MCALAGRHPRRQRSSPDCARTVLGTDLCRDDKSVFVVSAKGYVTSQANCTIQWLTETAGADGPIYSAHMRCSNPAAPEQMTEVNRIIMPNDRGELSTGPDFRQLKVYRRCPSN